MNDGNNVHWLMIDVRTAKDAEDYGLPPGTYPRNAREVLDVKGHTSEYARILHTIAAVDGHMLDLVAQINAKNATQDAAAAEAARSVKALAAETATLRAEVDRLRRTAAFLREEVTAKPVPALPLAARTGCAAPPATVEHRMPWGWIATGAIALFWLGTQAAPLLH
jgi:hypothetical protein